MARHTVEAFAALEKATPKRSGRSKRSAGTVRRAPRRAA
jgi:hypothetical protein